jgi:hypothetical protein
MSVMLKPLGFSGSNSLPQRLFSLLLSPARTAVFETTTHVRSLSLETMADVSKAYEVLGLSPSRKVSGGSEERRGRLRIAEVKRAFLAKAKHAHPDAGGNNEAFHELSLALSRVLEDLKGTSELTRREILQEMRSFEDERLKEKFKS